MFYVIILIVIAFIVFYKFPGILPESWRIRSGEDMNNYMFNLNPGEKILHRSIGVSDANSHLTAAEVKKKNITLGMMGQKIAEDKIVHLAITDQNRLIISHDVRSNTPVFFDKTNFPHITDTGRKASRMSGAALKFLQGYHPGSGNTRIIEIDSPSLPEIMIHANTGKFEVSLAVEFIPILMEWVKKNQTYKENF